MSRSELELAIGWARDEGWNPGLHDATPFHAADPEGFLVGVLDGRPISSISVVRYGQTFGFLGFYIVIPEERGHGYGYRLWQAGMARLAGRLVGLDGVPAQQDNYRRSGFELAYRNIRYGGTAPALARRGPARRPRACRSSSSSPSTPGCSRRRGPASSPGGSACRRAGRLPRVDDGELRGFGVRRRCGNGHKIGPLYATSREIAESLFDGLCEGIAGEPVFLDVPEPNAEAVALAEGRDLAPAFETARMYTGPAPAIELDQLYGVTTFELG